MLTPDTRVPLMSAPLSNHVGEPHPVTPLPGLRAGAVQGLESSFPGTLSTAMRSLLSSSCGLAGSELGSIDFTSRWYPEEPLAVFRPCLTLAVDDEGRRWIAETSRREGLPGPVWCVFPDPEVAMYVTDDLAGLLSKLQEGGRRNRTSAWLRSLTAEARSVWALRQNLAQHSQNRCRSDRAIRGWLASVPFDAWVYDVRASSPARGWPYGLAGPDGCLYRCGRLPVFAVAGRSPPHRWARHMAEIAATHALPQAAIARQRLS